MEEHLLAHYAFYGEFTGVRTARKHIGWYVNDLVGGETFRQRMNRIESCQEQLTAVHDFFDSLTTERLQYCSESKSGSEWGESSRFTAQSRPDQPEYSLEPEPEKIAA